jgi:pimeloyl-[acyl-carrier protein] methyl ester esterase
MSGSLHIDASGEGPPLVLLHGWAMHSGLWGPLVKDLARRYRVHAVDLPGHGASAAPAEFTLAGVVAALAAAFPPKGPPLTVVGWSLGGQVAMRWALAAPERVDRIVLVATSPRFVAGDDWPHAMSAATLDRFGDELRIAWKLTVQRFLSLQLQGSDPPRATLAELKHRLFSRDAPSPATLAAALAVLRDTDLRFEIAGIAQPTLVVSGDRDTLALPAAGRYLADHLPNARFALIAGAAHVPFLSHAEAFGEALDDFLDAN